MLGEIQNNIEKLKIALSNKDKQLVDLGKLLKAAKIEYQKVVIENKQLREYILTNRKKRRTQTTKNSCKKTITTKI